MINTFFLVSTAYFPPVQYISLFRSAEKILIEREETYLKQTYRNRCCIYSANGPMILTVPVLLGSFHKTPVKDIRIDYSKRWQQIHLGALISSYKSAPFFEYYFHAFEGVINRNHSYLLDLNLHSLETILTVTGIDTPHSYTTEFTKPEKSQSDYRNSISPKNDMTELSDRFIRYSQVFDDRYGFVPNLSAIDLVFNTGPDAKDYLMTSDS